MLDTSFLTEVLALTYTDSFSVHRIVTQVDSDGASYSGYFPVDSLTDVSCRISFESDDASNNYNDAANETDKRIEIFTRTNTSILKGDKVVASRKDAQGNVLGTYTGIANLPSHYDNHTKLVIVMEGEA